MYNSIKIIVVVGLFVGCCVANYRGNYALSFDGIDDLVTVPHSYQDYLLHDHWTLEAWIYPTAEQSYWQLNIVGYPQRHPNMNYCGSGNSQCQPGDPIVQLRERNGGWFTAVGNAAKVAPNQWHHIAGSWDNVTLSLYVDGVLDVNIQPYTQGYTEALSCRTNNMLSCEYGLQIGGNLFRVGEATFSSQYFRGYIDDVRVWTHGRTQQDIISTMNTALTGTETGLLYYWRFDDFGTQLAKSSSYDIYALLGGGIQEAEPIWVQSTAPLSAPANQPTRPPPTPEPVYVTKSTGPAVTAGALIGVFCLVGGLAFGLIIGLKVIAPRFGGGAAEGSRLLG